MAPELVFLLDVDNTLLDNDRIVADLGVHLTRAFGPDRSARFWAIFESLRAEVGYADYLGALQRYRADVENLDGGEEQLLSISGFLIDYPFAERLYPRALEVIAHLDEIGQTVILSDGDVVFQPRKVHRSGLWRAVRGRVLIYVHKELMLEAIEHRYPAARYVMVDDKQRVLTAMKEALGHRVVTVFPRQGHYALDPANVARYPAADISVDRIADLLGFDAARWRAALTSERSP